MSKFKQLQRQYIKKIRHKLSAYDQQSASTAICDQIRKLELYRYAKRLALFRSVGQEIDLTALWYSAASVGKYCFFPVINEAGLLSFIPATPSTPFKENRYGILEPQINAKEACAIDSLNIIFLPLLFFDKKGTRIGMGAGYYDRTLAQQKPQFLIGVAYDFQEEAYLIPEPNDVPLDMVVTPSRILWCEHD